MADFSTDSPIDSLDSLTGLGSDSPLGDFGIVPFDSGIGEGDLGSITSATDPTVAETLGSDVTGTVSSDLLDTGNPDVTVQGGGLDSSVFNEFSTSNGLNLGESALSDLFDSLAGIDKVTGSGIPLPIPKVGSSSKPKSTTAPPKPITSATKPLTNYIVQKDASGNTQLTTIGILLVVLVAIIVGALIFGRKQNE